MVQKINVTRNKIGLEDVLFGVGAVTQTRGGEEVTVTKINAANLPFDETSSLAETMTSLDEAKTFLESYGDTLDTLAANIAHLLTIELVEISGSGGDAATLQGSNLAQVRANINATQLEGQTLAQVRAGINATQLEGQTLAQVRADIDAATLGGSTLSQVRAGIDAATLGGSTLSQVRTGINAAQLEGQTLAQVREGGNAATLQGSNLSSVIAAATVGDATTSTKGKVELATDTEAKAGTATALVVDPAQVGMHPLVPVAWAFATINDSSVVLGSKFNVSAGSINNYQLPLSFTLGSSVSAGYAVLHFISCSNGTLKAQGYGEYAISGYGSIPAHVVPPKEVYAAISGSSVVNFGNLHPGNSYSGAGQLFTVFMVVYGTRS